MEQKDNTEQKILLAAQQVFIKKGMDGARMQEIADEAGINKALLHYYFRSKQKLFEAVFAFVIKKAFPNMREILTAQMGPEEKIDAFVDNYMAILYQNQFIPGFLIKEVNRDPDMIANIFIKSGLQPQILLEGIQKELNDYGIQVDNIRSWMVNLISLLVFPFAAAPLIQRIIFENDEQAFQTFLSQRAQEIKVLIKTLILKK